MTNLARLAPAALLLAAIPTSFVSAQDTGQAAYTVVETGQRYARLQEAVNAIGDGTGTIRFGSARFADCAVQTAGDILYTAAVPGQSVLDGVTCEGKAALVLRGRSAKVEGLVFTNMRVADFNGAGIRVEHGNLSVSQSWFRDSQQGILAANDPSGTIAIDKSTFSRLGTCEGAGGCAHSIYIGEYGALTVTRSRFEAGRGGHYVKSRSIRTGVLNSSFDDAGGRQTNYMIDLPVGSTGRIAGNWFVQGLDKDNHSAMIVIGAEGHTYSANGLVIEGNDARFAIGAERACSFVVDFTGDRLALGQNTLAAGLTRFDKR